jgi:hypothetical protein
MNITIGLTAPATEPLFQSFGLLGILVIVFAESGLLVGSSYRATHFC